MHLGAIADDLTGATDLALILSRAGFSVVQVADVPASGKLPEADAVVVALKSRTIPVGHAVQKSLAAARALLAGGAQQLFFKYCSTFDSTDKGNIGPVAEALMHLVGARATIACPAFPRNGRTIYRGHLFVGDVLLSDSPMKDHPLTPMRDANLVRVLQRQCVQKVSLVPLETVRSPERLTAALSDLEGLAIVDAVADEDLIALGRAVKRMKLITGGSALAMGLAQNFGLDAERGQDALDWPAGQGAILAGSCSAATLRQIEAYRQSGAPVLPIVLDDVVAGAQTPEQAAAFCRDAGDQAPLIYASAEPDAVAANQARFGVAGAGERIEHFMAELAVLLARSGVTRFVVAGGETSGAVSTALGVSTQRIGPEIDPGVPWTLAETRHGRLALALKSGNFGADDFFAKSLGMLT
jgi:uncharacterized protein YgbK (DUF1537 family)